MQPHNQPRLAQPGDSDPSKNERNTKTPKSTSGGVGAHGLLAVQRSPSYQWPLLPWRKEDCISEYSLPIPYSTLPSEVVCRMETGVRDYAIPLFLSAKLASFQSTAYP